MSNHATMNEAPLISVITVCLNEPQLERTCESIVTQTFQNFEWVVIDGGSNEETLKIFDRYKYRINYFISEKDNGIYDGMNKGIKIANGKWLNFMNAGDYFAAHDAMEEIAKFIKKFKTFDVLHGITQFEGIGHIQKRMMALDKKINKKFWMNKTIPHQSTFYKRNLFYQYGNYDISFNVYADYDFNVRLYFNNCKFVHIDYIIANCDNSGVSFSNIMHYQERIRILNKYYTNEEIAMNMKEKFNELRARSSKHIKHVK